MKNWFQPLFENDGPAGGGATGDDAGATGDGSGLDLSPGSDDKGGAEGNQGAGPDRANLPKWTAGVKVELRDKVKQFQTPTDLAQAFIDASGKLENAVILPGEDATEEERAAYLERMGVPKEPKEYELTRPDLPEGVTYDEAFETWFRETAKVAGLSKAQAKTIFDGYNKRVVDNIKAAQEKRKQNREQAKAKLVEKLGEEQAEAVLARGRKAVRMLGNPAFDGFLDRTGLSDDPNMIQFMGRIGELISDDVIAQGGVGLKPQPTDPNDSDSWDLPGLED